MKRSAPTSRGSKAQVRIIEAVMASGLIFITFFVAVFLVQAPTVPSLQEKADLDRLGYNVLSGLIESGIIEQTLNSGSSTQLANSLRQTLPSATYFDLTITKYSKNPVTQWIEPENLPDFLVSNTDPASFASSKTISSTSMLFTSHNGNIYHLTLILAKAGGI